MYKKYIRPNNMSSKNNGFARIELLIVILFFIILIILSNLGVKYIIYSRLNLVIEEIKEYSNIEFSDQNIKIFSKFNPNAFWSIKTTQDGKRNFLVISRNNRTGIFNRNELLYILEKTVGYKFIIISNDKEVPIESLEDSNDRAHKYYFGIVID